MRRATWIALLGLAISGANGLGATAVEHSTDSSSKHPISFSADVAPILYANCVSCHRPGEVAPFPLISFEQVKKHAHQIVDVTGSRRMPPWKADAGAEMFLDARRLTDAQIQTLSTWVAQGMPEGNPHDLPALPKFTPGWQLGEPDVVLAPSAEYHVDAEGDDIYRCFVLKTDYPQDRYLSGMEIRPGNRKVVHHVMGYVDARHDARRLDGTDGQPGYSAFGGIGFAPAGTLEGWGPGIQPRILPDGVGMFLPAGSAIVIQVHYHKTGKPETDLTRVGLHFARKPVDRRLNMAVALNPTLRIPPGAKHEEVRASMEVPEDISLIRIAPHMHLLGHDMSIMAGRIKGDANLYCQNRLILPSFLPVFAFSPACRPAAGPERMLESKRIGRRLCPCFEAHRAGAADVLFDLGLLGIARRRIEYFKPVVRTRHGPLGQDRPQIVGAIEPDERAAPAPVLRPLGERWPHGVALDVAQHRQQMPVLLNWKALEPSLIQMPMPHSGVCVLPTLGVRERQPSHEGGQLAIFLRPQHQMKMIGHQAPGEDADRHALVCLGKHLFESDVILVLLEQPQSAIGAIEHVIDQSARSFSGDAGHGSRR